jgi:hypothetical protein
MVRYLIILGLVVLVVGLMWPRLRKLGLGQLPGDVVIQRKSGAYYFPFATCVVLSLLLSLVLWLVGR